MIDDDVGAEKNYHRGNDGIIKKLPPIVMKNIRLLIHDAQQERISNGWKPFWGLSRPEPLWEPLRRGRGRRGEGKEEGRREGGRKGRAERPREIQRSPKRPRETQKGPEMPREAQKGPERPREAQRGPEMPREAQRGPERPREAHRGPERQLRGSKSIESSESSNKARGYLMSQVI